MTIATPAQHCLRAFNGASNVPRMRNWRLMSAALPTLPISRMFSSSSRTLTQRPPVIRKARRDAYAREQARLKAAANLSRRQNAEAQRRIQLGDSLRGVETAFTRSFDDPPQTEPTESDQADRSAKLNFYISDKELDHGLKRSKWLLDPNGLIGGQRSIQDLSRGMSSGDLEKEYEDQHKRAAEAMRRISQLSLGSSKDKLRVNVQRCIQTFGRHTTDGALRKATSQQDDGAVRRKERAGPDTGSSEVQVGILTAKIRILTKFIEGRGRMDKMNRRNLQLLVHRRQKLLKYLQRQDKGGLRWQHLVTTLGLTDGTWKGEISVPRYLS